MKRILHRYVEDQVQKDLHMGKSVLLLGSRQTGKTTFIREVLKSTSPIHSILLQDPSVRLRYEQDPGLLIRDAQAIDRGIILFVDEIQKVPDLFDSVQYLIDEEKRQCILTGSSMRKLRRQQTNLLPGRVLASTMTPLLFGELGLLKESRLACLQMKNCTEALPYTWEELAVFGALPEVILSDTQTRKRLLTSYATTYVEEEIRAEALARNLGSFQTFLQVIAQESGSAINISKLSEQTHVSMITIREYISILQDTLILLELPLYSKKIRRQLAGKSKQYLFDTGIRNALQGAPLDLRIINVQKGILFEHMVILELFRRQSLLNDRSVKLSYWRTRTGLEVDVIISLYDEVIPIEIKAARDISLRDIPGLLAFMEEHSVKKGYVVTLDERPQKLSETITAIPWNYL